MPGWLARNKEHVASLIPMRSPGCLTASDPRLALAPPTPRVVKMPEVLAREAFITRLDSVFSEEECANLISLADANGYSPALLNVGNGEQILAPEVRSSSRSIIDSEELAGKIWERVAAHAPDVWPLPEFVSTPMRRPVVALNERLRFLKYNVGEYFRQHGDGMYVRPNGERSYVTVLLYLNSGYEGGRTTFTNSEGQRFEIEPRAGTVVLHDHRILHESPPVKSGTKFIMRTDLMFTPAATSSWQSDRRAIGTGAVMRDLGHRDANIIRNDDDHDDDDLR